MKAISRRGFTGGLFAGALGAALDSSVARAASLPSSAEPGETAKELGPLLTAEWQLQLPGIWRARLGAPEAATPVTTRMIPPARESLSAMPSAVEPPLGKIEGCARRRGFDLALPLESGELMYGFGSQMYSVMHRGSKKTLRVNADPKVNSGDAHAPVPFYITTRGYAVLVDTARYAVFYCDSTQQRQTVPQPDGPAAYSDVQEDPLTRYATPGMVRVEVPEAAGVDVYLFAGPTMREAMARYNLFCGGGVNPPEWGLGFWYRCYLNATDLQVLALADEFRVREIPCDVLGLEPNWQSHAYACSFLWDAKKFPDPRTLVSKLKVRNYELNLWEHAYTHKSAPIYSALEPLSGDYKTFGGLVPDFTLPEARRIFSDHQKKEFIDLGVSGFKLDECDNSDFTGGWAFPEMSRFPSGLDGEQMHSLFGIRYQDTLLDAFRRAGKPTYGLVRSSGALAAPYPFVLYSDLYDHRVFVRALINAGFSGLLFCPEVRDAESVEDLLRRMQTAVFSPLAMVNGWYIQDPPWKQLHASWETFHEREKDPGKLDEGWEAVEAQCRIILGWRMQLVPYLRAAFAEYAEYGVPPFRAPIMDYPAEGSLALVEDQYMVGDRMLVAPVFAGQTSRKVVLPPGAWCDYWTGSSVEGGKAISVPTPLDRIPVYVRAGSVLPVAEVGLSAGAPNARRLIVRVYGDGSIPFVLRQGRREVLRLAWNQTSHRGNIELGGTAGEGYTVTKWTPMHG